MIPTLPLEATPSERAILFAYSQGIVNPMEIVRLLRPKSKQKVYQTLKQYEEILPSLRIVAPAQHFIGRGLIR